MARTPTLFGVALILPVLVALVGAVGAVGAVLAARADGSSSPD